MSPDFEVLLAELAEGLPTARAAVFGQGGETLAAVGPDAGDSRFPQTAVRLISSSDGLRETVGEVLCITALYPGDKAIAVVPAGETIFAVLSGDTDAELLHTHARTFAHGIRAPRQETDVAPSPARTRRGEKTERKGPRQLRSSG